MNQGQRKEITESLIAYRKDKGVSAAHIVAMALETGYSIGARDASDYLIQKLEQAQNTETVLVAIDEAETA